MGRTVEGIANGIDEGFFKDDNEAERTLKGIERVLDDFFERRDLDKTTKDVIEFLEELWGHFSIDKYAKIFVDFARAEKALYGFAERYRDHLIHVFNVFIMGILVFSKILKQDQGEIFKLLKIRSESKKVPFPSKYDERRRLYYLWCLISTFHDIAIPIDRRRDILEGLNRFLGYFRIETERLRLKFPFTIQSDFSRYSDLMAKLFANGVVMSGSAENPTYELPDNHTTSSLYFQSVLNSAIDKYDHGVMGAYFLFKSIEEMFLSGKNPNVRYDLDVSAMMHNGKKVDLPKNKRQWNGILRELNLSEEELNNLQRIYDLTRGETKCYNDYVFEQDVTRAAIAIALHNLDPFNNPKIFPIRFLKLPLSYLLILFDELQEFCRPEGFVLTEIVRFYKFPKIDVDVKFPTDKKPRIQISLGFDLEKPRLEIEEQAVNEYNKWVGNKKKLEVKTYEELVCATWTNIFETINKKLSFGDEESIEIYVKVTLEGKDPNGKALKFRSSNWTDYP